MDNLKILDIIINKEEDLMEIFDILHDSVCAHDDIIYYDLSKSLKITFYREYFEEKSEKVKKKFLLFFYRYKFPYAKCELCLENVKCLNLLDLRCFRIMKEHYGIFSYFNTIIKKENTYTLLFEPELIIELFFENGIIKGYFKDLEIMEKIPFVKNIF